MFWGNVSRSPADARILISLLNGVPMKGFTSESPLFRPPGLIWIKLKAIKRLWSTDSSRTDTERTDITRVVMRVICTAAAADTAELREPYGRRWRRNRHGDTIHTPASSSALKQLHTVFHPAQCSVISDHLRAPRGSLCQAVGWPSVSGC